MASLLHLEEPASPAAQPGRPHADWHAFLELGFRPLYLAGCLWAMLAMLLWVFGPMPEGRLAGVFWHAHEMLWGFVATVAVGFLLTATTNWTGRNPLHGPALGVMVLLWLMARLAWLWPGSTAFVWAEVFELLFFFGAALALARVIYATRNRRNYAVPVLIAGLGLADALFLYGTGHGDPVVVMQYFNSGLLCMAVIALLVAGRVMPFFAMRALPGLQLPMLTVAGRIQLAACALGLLLGLAGKEAAMGSCLAVTASISLMQLVAWKFWAVRKVPLLWVLYVAFAMLALGLWLAAIRAWGVPMRLAWPAHVIGVGGFALMIIGMVTRTSLGHLGRPLRADRSMVVAYLLVMLATVLRLALLAGPQALSPGMAALLLHASAMAWIFAFGLYVWRFFPWLIRPRLAPLESATPIQIIRRK